MSKSGYYSDERLQAVSDLKMRLIQAEHFLANSGITFGIAGDNPYRKEINTAADGIIKAYQAMQAICDREMDAREQSDESDTD